MTEEVRLVAFYMRVSSQEQRERRTIENQYEILRRHLERNPEVTFVACYTDDAVSGMTPLPERPAGQRLLDDARRGKITEIWVVRADRLGRDAADLLVLWRSFQEASVKLVGVEQSIESYLTYGIQALIADNEHETLLARSAAGMARAAREGRYCGGIVPLGYRREGKSHQARLVPSDIPIWPDWTEADLVRQIYHWLAVERWSCRRIADHLNDLGVHTVYAKDGRQVAEDDGLGGRRKKRTQNRWRPGRIRNLVVNPVYKGELHYGRRSKKARDVIVASVRPLVSQDVWDAAQDTLAANRIMPKNAKHSYLLTGLIKCGLCGLNHSGSMNRGVVWYRCNGQLVERGPVEGRCPGKSIRGDHLEPMVWADIESFLCNPGDLIEELASERNCTSAAATAEAERTALRSALEGMARQRDVMLDALRHGDITRDEFAAQAEKMASERRAIEDRLAELEPVDPEPDLVGEDVLAEIRQRVRAGLDQVRRREVTRLLVRRITIHTEFLDEGRRKKKARAVVEYRFPAVVNNHTGRGSSRPPA